ncbi:MAG: DNA gyrase subunit A, partial [Muribaculaceae bacterium]|nr:DNA gyrase subunit A [Muribaculaceae bacterium]
NKLYKMTQMQASFSVNNVALVNGRPKTLNLKEILQEFIAHRHEVVIRRTRFDLRKATERAHILEGLIIASQNIDEVIKIIRGSASPDIARATLTERFGLTEAQTAAIVEMRLRQLTGLEQDKLRNEYDELQKTIAYLESILNDDSVCRKVMKDELTEVRDKYGDARRTDIDYVAGDFNAEDFYADEEMIITISRMGYIKRTSLSEFRVQNRGGVGSRGSNTREEDFIEYIYPASMHNNLLFFTKKGLHYRLKVYDIPEGAKNTKGRAIQNLLNIAPDDAITTVIKVKDVKDPNLNLVFATKMGVVKRTALVNYSSSIAAKGVKSMAIDEGDQLVGVELTDGNYQIMLANRNGRAIRFHEDTLRKSGRTSGGVRGMKLDGGGDEVVGLVAVPDGSDPDVLVLSENGYGKRSLLDAYRVTNRGAKGVRTMKVTQKTGSMVALQIVDD